MESISLYSEARNEYLKQMASWLSSPIVEFFRAEYQTISTMTGFQAWCADVPKWNQDVIDTNVSKILDSCRCDYVEELMTAVFIAHTKILSAIRLHAKPRRKIQITVPKPDHFMHRALSECSRILWSNVYLFSDSVSSLDRQKNTNDVNRFLEDGILQAIRNLLPVKSILRDSLQDDDDDAVQITNLNDTPTIETAITETSDTETPVIETVVTDRDIVNNDAPQDVSEIKSVDVKPVESQVVNVNKELESNNLVIDTEKTVGFTGMDSIFGIEGDAELRPMIEENSDQFQIIGNSELLNGNEFEDLDSENQPPIPLGADDYESL